MVCLAIWLQMIATEPISKFIMIWLPIELFISSGFDHLVVNEFLIPGGIIVGGSYYDSRVNWGNASWYNFIPVTIGSIIGAWFLVRRGVRGAFKTLYCGSTAWGRTRRV